MQILTNTFLRTLYRAKMTLQYLNECLEPHRDVSRRRGGHHALARVVVEDGPRGVGVRLHVTPYLERLVLHYRAGPEGKRVDLRRI